MPSAVRHGKLRHLNRLGERSEPLVERFLSRFSGATTGIAPGLAQLLVLRTRCNDGPAPRGAAGGRRLAVNPNGLAHPLFAGLSSWAETPTSSANRPSLREHYVTSPSIRAGCHVWPTRNMECQTNSRQRTKLVDSLCLSHLPTCRNPATHLKSMAY
jgi:hypothetical protein